MGIVSGPPEANADGYSILLAKPGSVVDCKVDAAYGSISPGDLLTTSPTIGHAMRAENPKLGTVIGQAVAGRREGRGFIKVKAVLH